MMKQKLIYYFGNASLVNFTFRNASPFFMTSWDKTTTTWKIAAYLLLSKWIFGYSPNCIVFM